MSVEKKVLMSVWDLANQDVYRKVGNLFDTSRDGAQTCTIEACCAIAVHHLKPVYIRLPTVPQYAQLSLMKLSRSTVSLVYVDSLIH